MGGFRGSKNQTSGKCHELLRKCFGVVDVLEVSRVIRGWREGGADGREVTGKEAGKEGLVINIIKYPHLSGNTFLQTPDLSGASNTKAFGNVIIIWNSMFSTIWWALARVLKGRTWGDDYSVCWRHIITEWVTEGRCSNRNRQPSHYHEVSNRE